MTSMTSKHRANMMDVLVIGAGPAGIAAATAAAEHGCSVLMLDDNEALGGQIWRASTVAPDGRKRLKNSQRVAALERLRRSGAKVLHGYHVFDAPAPHTVRALREDRHGSHGESFQFKQMILATGARERFIPFPGWTLPGVFGAGGLQALAKGGFSVKKQRIAVAGSGPLLLAVAAHLKEDGASITCIAEQASLATLAKFALSLWSSPAKLWQGIRYRSTLIKTPLHTGCWPVEALAVDGKLRSVRLTNGHQTWEEPCDLLACGFHLVPNTELAQLLNCTLDAGYVKVDAMQRTSVPHVFCVGEPTGIGGLECALLQGKLAGLVCAGQQANALQRQVAAQRTFVKRLEHTFALRPEIRTSAQDETLLCRCEDVALGRLREHSGWTGAKLQTRCGMGPCQGRICGPAAEFLLGWEPASVRPPIFPVPLDALCINEEAIEENV